ncbi:hypothetical protein MMC13_007060 [Lambiella insularis]|nr:hypothetical protein [Lambiella insularis]
MADDILILEKEYCPPIDSALFFAIISDYDLSQEPAIRELRSTLDALKTSAEAEESTAFDPSGSSNYEREGSLHDSVDRPQSWNGDALSRTEDTDLTSLSHSIDSFRLNEGAASSSDKDTLELESLSVSDKEALLGEMFPSLKPFDISYTLKKSHSSFTKAVESLLNQVFLLSEPTSDGEQHFLPKGIDAFAVPSHPGRKGKSRRRKNNTHPRRSSSTPAPLSDKSPNTPVSKWDQAKADIDFLTQRTFLSSQTITSAYHASHASLSATILALCALSPQNPYLTPSDPILSARTIDLAHHFPSLPPARLTALIHLTHPSTASAHDLALALTTSPSSSLPPILTAHYALPIPSTSPPSPTPPSPSTPLPHASALALSATAASHSRAHFSQASSLHRLSKSKPLLAGAASYYATRGQEASTSAAHYASLAADALVAAQSTGASTDLHGVSVRDGVRIARRRVEEWWASGAAEWAREGKVQGSGGYRVVVGLGRHSEGGRGRLGPAVGGMLVREGWRLEVGEGVLVVRGRARR